MKNISVPAGLLALCACALCALANEDDHWDVKFGASGADGLVTSMTTSGSDVYVTGCEFTRHTLAQLPRENPVNNRIEGVSGWP